MCYPLVSRLTMGRDNRRTFAALGAANRQAKTTAHPDNPGVGGSNRQSKAATRPDSTRVNGLNRQTKAATQDDLPRNIHRNVGLHRSFVDNTGLGLATKQHYNLLRVNYVNPPGQLPPLATKKSLDH
jgi:hypothetical protein